MTPTSLVPQEAAAVGISYGETLRAHCKRIFEGKTRIRLWKH